MNVRPHIEFISPLAMVHPGVKIGARTRVWPFASVIRGSEIGDDCSIATCAIVDGCRLGDRVIVSHGAFLDPGMVIGDDVFIGPHVCFCNDPWPKSSKVGWFESKDLFGPDRVTVTLVSDNASIGAGAILMPGIRIGSNAMVAAGSVVTKSVGPDMLYKRDGSMVVASDVADRKRYIFR